MRVLDLCVSRAEIYQEWNEVLGDDFIGIDVRSGQFVKEKDEKHWAAMVVEVSPTVRSDMKALPFMPESFDIAILDPPMKNAARGHGLK